jgi:hypothetical protein
MPRAFAMASARRVAFELFAVPNLFRNWIEQAHGRALQQPEDWEVLRPGHDVFKLLGRVEIVQDLEGAVLALLELGQVA